MGKVGFLCISRKLGDEMRLNAICWQAREGLAQAALILLLNCSCSCSYTLLLMCGVEMQPASGIP